MRLIKLGNKIMKTLDFEKTIEELLFRFPEFSNSEDRKQVYDNDGAYIYFSYFGDFLLDKIDKSENDEFIKKAFNYMNEIFDREGMTTDIWDLFNIELFERFDFEDKYKILASKYLKGKALLAFQNREGRPMN